MFIRSNERAGAVSSIHTNPKLNFVFSFSQNRVEYERRVREQAMRFRDPSLT